MIKSYVSYMLKCYLRSFKYVAVLLFFIVVVCAIYWQKRVPMWNTYSLTVNIIFIFSSWISIGFLDSEDNVLQQLLFLRSTNKNFYYLSKIVSIWIVCILFSFIIVFVPILENLFIGPIYAYEVALSFGIHAFISLLSILIVAFFYTRILSDRRAALSVLVVFLLICMLQVALIQKIPIFKYITWVFPPISFASETMINLDGMNMYSIVSKMLVSILYAFFYSVILMFLYCKMMLRRLF